MEFNFVINWTTIFMQIFVHYSYTIVNGSPAPAPAASSYTRELSFEVFENVPSGTLIGVITGPTPPYLTVGLDSNDLSIDESNGEIRTQVEILDRELRESYSFIVIPISGGTGDNLRVSVHVRDVNDNAPTFPVASISVEFAENTPRDVKRTLVPARDADLGIFSTQKYSITDGNLNNAFRLSSHRERDGVLYLDLQVNGFLDRETTPFYNLVIDAYDGGLPPLKGSLTVLVSLEDVNDNSPIFNQSRYFATISENATFGSPVLQVFATDTDSGPNGQVTYSINRRQTDKDSTFQIDRLTGVISVNRPLDYESKESHELVVVARDSGLQPLETTVFVSIRVIDVNDHEPVISPTYLTPDGLPQIYENSGTGSFIARLSVIDPRDSNVDYSSKASIQISSGAHGEFGITRRNGVNYLMVTSNHLDREKKSDYLINLIATSQSPDTTPTPFNISSVIKLKILDVNDNAPIFTQSEYFTSVLEVAEPGTGILQLSATDSDLGNSSKVSYEIFQGSKWFTIHPSSGLISTVESLDCETEPIPKLVIIARDHGTPSLSSTTIVHVQIQDVNDNEPVFDYSFYNVSIKEDSEIGRPILKVSASDPDCGINSIVKYSFHGPPNGLDALPFAINDSTGEIRISKALDYEAKSIYTLSVEAMDSGGLGSIAIVKISILDVNDNDPIFYPTTYESTIPISALSSGTLILIVKATDLDSNSQLKYSIVDGNPNSIFSISNGKFGEGQITINRVPRTESKFNLKLKAEDKGGRAGFGEANIHIIGSANQGTFNEIRYSFTIDETVGVGSIIGTVALIHQQGSKKPSSSSPKYKILSGDPNNYFQIDENSGVISTTAQLDHENHPMILLNIEAMTPSLTSLSTFTQAQIQVSDINDHDPEFESQQVTIWVPEGTKVGTVLYVVHATDRDVGFITYTMTSTTEHFSLDPSTGQLVLRESLDYENVKKYRLVVGAKDSGIPQRFSRTNLTINIEVQDVNDNSPIFEQEEYRVQISEFAPIGTNLTQIRAIDQDTGNNAKITYSLKKQSGNSRVFSLDSNTGTLVLKSKLDRETQDLYHLQVVALDHGNPIQLSSTATVRVEVLDENDHEPIFEQSSYKFTIEENNEPGSIIGKIEATDRDSGRNGQIQYLIQPSHSSFSIESKTGILTATVPLDREKQSYYELQIIGFDTGSPIPLQSETLVYVRVSDSNDWSPRIIEPEVDRLVISDGVGIGTELTQIVASDLDDGENARVEFSFVSDGGDSQDFSIDPVSGIIRTKSILSTKSKPFYNLVVRARDHGSPSLETLREYRIEVVEDSDSDITPRFRRSKFNFKISESARIGQVVGSIGESFQYYKIVGESESWRDFEIEHSTGKILVARPLDYETKSHYMFELGPIESSEGKIQISIYILDENDQSPKFPEDPVLFNVPESTPVGSYLWNFTAVDLDDGLNGIVHYNIQEQSPEIAFRINPLSGSLYLTQPLDFERETSYLLIIGATDQAADPGKRKSTNLTVQILIEDENDNAPIFLSPSRIVLYRNEPIHRTIHNLIAVDNDSNSTINYSIISGNEDNSFTLNSITGELSLKKLLSRSIYHLNVTAKDNENLHSTSQLLQISVQEFNGESSSIGSGARAINSPPKFHESRYETRVQENSAKGTEVVKVAAGSGSSGDIKYIIPRSMSQGKFSIHPTSGVITVSGSIDRESLDQYNITVYAYNSGGVYDKASVLIKILDLNDNAPILRCTDLSVPENQDPSIIHHFHGIDADLGKNGEINYSILSGNTDNLFSIDLHNGKFKSRSLDRERRSIYNLIVIAQDQGLPAQKTTCNFTLRVLDQNDNSPVFLENEYSVSISENVAVGTTVLVVEATDPDQGKNSELRYFLHNETQWEFGIDSLSGTIFTKGLLDRETVSEYVFEVIATDSGLYDSRSSKTVVRISLNDINDNPPAFGPSENGDEDENALTIVKLDTSTGIRPGTLLTQVSATDPDEGLNSEILYELLDNYAGKFRMNSQTGAITTTPTTSKLEPKTYYLNVMAKDQGFPQLNSTQVIMLQIGNTAQLQNPIIKFSKSEYIAKIPENSPIGTELLQVNAYRTDGRKQRIIYTIIHGNELGAFSIGENTGKLIIANSTPLDREKQKEFNLVISAQYESHLAHSAVHIEILDENDNVPTFTQENYFGTVREGGTKGTIVVQIKALDSDESSTNLNYYILDGNLDNSFKIDPPGSGLIKTNFVLDREIQDTYTLSVICTDEGNPPNSGSATVTIRVIDTNDNFPILPPISSISVSETLKVGSVVTSIVGNDVDTGPSLTYSFTRTGNPGQTFSIGKYNGEITLAKSLNFIHQEKHELEVQVLDSVHSARSTVTVNVAQNLRNKKDRGNVFDKEIYHINIGEETRPGTKIFQPSVTKNVKYSLQSLSPIASKLYMDENTGGIFTNASLAQAYISNVGPFANELTLIGMDAEGKNNILGMATVWVEFKSSETDGLITFVQPHYSVDLKSTDKPGTLVLKPTIEFENSNNKLHLHYELIGHEETFTINSHSGEIRTAKLISRATTFTLNISASCINAMECKAFTLATVNVSSDESQSLSPAESPLLYNVTLSESTSIGSTIFKLNPTLTNSYTISSGNVGLVFGIVNSGEIIVRNALDFERIPEYNLVIRSGNQNSELIKLHIQIQDSNDHIPTFPLSNYQEFIRENQPAGTPVFTISAVDLDTGNLTYAILENNMKDKFTIHPESGLISTLVPFDYESMNRYYLTVRASDEGGQFSSVRVQIDVLSQDEFEPRFSSLQYQWTIPSNARSGYVLGRIYAQDQDSGVDGYVRYTIVGKKSQFRVNRTTGILMLKEDVQILVNESLQVQASSGKPGSKRSVVPVQIFVGEPSAEIELAAAGLTGNIVPWIIGSLLGALLIILIVFTIVIVRGKNRAQKKQTEDNGLSPKSAGQEQYQNSSTLEYPVGLNSTYLSPEYSDCRLSHTKSHSGSSSGRGSAVEMDEDEEIRMINGADAASSYIQQTLWESVIHDGEECLEGTTPSPAPAKNTQEYLARLGIVHNRSQQPGEEFYAQIPDEDEAMSPGNVIRAGSIGTGADQDDLRGSYNWDYLQDWGGPQYQSLVNVLGGQSEHGDTNDSESGTGTYSGVYNPKRAAAARQSIQSGKRAQGPLPPVPRSHGHGPSSVISHHDSFTSPMAPNFTPELSFCPPPTTGVVDRADLILGHPTKILRSTPPLQAHYNGTNSQHSSCYSSSTNSDIKI